MKENKRKGKETMIERIKRRSSREVKKEEKIEDVRERGGKEERRSKQR